MAIGDDITKHAGWMPGNPSMNVGGDLAPATDALSVSGSGTTLDAGNMPKGSSVSSSDSGDSLGAHIMESDYDSLFPGSEQGNLEKLSGGGVKGAD